MDQAQSPEARHEHGQKLVKRVILAGWVFVAISAACLYASKLVDGDDSQFGEIAWAVLLMVARMCGILSFAIGGLAIYNRRWTAGVMMMLLAVLLPVIAFIVYGTI